MSSERPVMPIAETACAERTVAVGYLSADLLSENRLELARRGLYAWTDALGIELVSVFIELDSAVPTMLWELDDEVRARGARYVVVPDLDHLSPHPLLCGERVRRLQASGAVTVLAIEASRTTVRLDF